MCFCVVGKWSPPTHLRNGLSHSTKFLCHILEVVRAEHVVIPTSLCTLCKTVPHSTLLLFNQVYAGCLQIGGKAILSKLSEKIIKKGKEVSERVTKTHIMGFKLILIAINRVCKVSVLELKRFRGKTAPFCVLYFVL